MRVDRKEIGKISQIYPSWLRVVCRSQYEITPLAIMEELRHQGIRSIETSPLFKTHQFAKDHHLLLSTADTKQVIEELHKCPQPGYSCRLSEHMTYSKRACWACKWLRDYYIRTTQEVKLDTVGEDRPLVQSRTRF